MGCICSKGSSKKDRTEYEVMNNKSSLQLAAPLVSAAQLGDRGMNKGSSMVVPHLEKSYSQINRGLPSEDKNNTSLFNVEKLAKRHHQRCATTVGSDDDAGNRKPLMSRILSMKHVAGEPIDAGWPLWLSSVAGEAIKGWVPRRADSFDKLDQIGQGAYSSVHKALDLETGKVVALKKVRFSSADADSVRFMAREIYILRKLDHPNVIKLEGIVTSRTSTSLYLVFEYMEHDLAGLAARSGMKFTEPQIKCYMQQLLRGLEHCHSRGVLHRDLKGSNLLIDNNGNLKIADFGLATVYQPEKKQPLTSRVVTLWYRAPELLLGATEYGVGIDMWSTGCILAELLIGKPIMPGRTEVEQMHKIFKLCGSPSEEYWQRTKFPHATSFKPQHPYERKITGTFKNFSPSALALVDRLLTVEPKGRGSATSALASEFFTTEPLPCDPSSLPKLPPSKEFDVKHRDKQEIRKNIEAVKGRGPVSVLRGTGDNKAPRTPEYNNQGDISLRGKPNTRMPRLRYESQEDRQPHCQHKVEAASVSVHGGYEHSSTSSTQRSQVNQATTDLSASSTKKEQGEPGTEKVGKKKRIHCSGPLMAASGNIDDMLREHEMLMQEAFRGVKRINPRNQGYQ